MPDHQEPSVRDVVNTTEDPNRSDYEAGMGGQARYELARWAARAVRMDREIQRMSEERRKIGEVLQTLERIAEAG